LRKMICVGSGCNHLVFAAAADDHFHRLPYSLSPAWW
jgi:hypothetical protein